MSRVMCPSFGQSGGASWGRVSYQQGLTRLVSNESSHNRHLTRKLHFTYYFTYYFTSLITFYYYFTYNVLKQTKYYVALVPQQKVMFRTDAS